MADKDEYEIDLSELPDEIDLPDKIDLSKLPDEVYARLSESLHYNIGSSLKAFSDNPGEFGHPMGVLVAIGRAFGIIRNFTPAIEFGFSSIISDYKSVSSELFTLAEKFGNPAGTLYAEYCIYFEKIFEILSQVRDIKDSKGANIVLFELQAIAHKVPEMNRAKLILASAYYFGCGVEKDRDKAVSYLDSFDSLQGYGLDEVRWLRAVIEKEIRMENRTKVFVSYSHEDALYENELSTMLKGMAYSSIVEFWDDRKLKIGGVTDDEIKTEMSLAKYIIMLVSMDYMASWYVRTHEFDELIEAAENEGATIFWIPIDDVPVIGTYLKKITPVIRDHTFLADEKVYPTKAIRSRVYKEIAMAIYNDLNPEPAQCVNPCTSK